MFDAQGIILKQNQNVDGIWPPQSHIVIFQDLSLFLQKNSS